MVSVKSFSLRRERNTVRLELMCSSSKFKEKMINLNIPVAQARSLLREMEKMLEGTSGENFSVEKRPRYIG